MKKEGFSFFLFHFLLLEILFKNDMNNKNISFAFTGFWGCDSMCWSIQETEQMDISFTSLSVFVERLLSARCTSWVLELYWLSWGT
jgi:hypothetical protein